MFWEVLPIEIRVYILYIRNNIRTNACIKIQEYWYNYWHPWRIKDSIYGMKSPAD